MQSIFRAHRRGRACFYIDELRKVNLIWKKGSDRKQWRFALRNRINIDRP